MVDLDRPRNLQEVYKLREKTLPPPLAKLQAKGMIDVIDSEQDDRGEYLVVAVYDVELNRAIRSSIEARLSEAG